MTENLGQRLLQLKADIEADEAEKNRKQGELDGILERLKTEFKLETLDEATAYLKKEQASIEKEEKALEKLVAEIEGAYEWE